MAVLATVGPALRLVVVSTEPEVQSGGAAPPGGEAHGPLGEELTFMSDLLKESRKSVDSGKLVAKFGERARSLVDTVTARGGPELGRSMEGMLEALFFQQLLLLRQTLAAKYERASRPIEAVALADTDFVAQAQDLVMPGSGWSYEEDRYALRAVLEGAYRREVAVQEEKVKAAQTQQSTVEIISKLQSQMEALQQKVQNLRAGSPWFLSTSYRIPKTPLQLIGRYQQGRTSLELSLNSDRDPANAEAGFVEGVGPMNLGLGLNVGM